VKVATVALWLSHKELRILKKRSGSSASESVWDYPRPPRLESSHKRIRVIFNKTVIADSQESLRVLETSHPPVYYIPPKDVRTDCLSASSRATLCEFKGVAHYWNLRVQDREVADAAWTYPSPRNPYEAIRGYFAFYPGLMDTCYVDDEKVRVQSGGFYGGWITADILGPFKGEKGTERW
jgi:uncharacterized protein (DUF427 family)